MNVKEAQHLRIDLEKDIAALLRDFKEKTGLTPIAINMDMVRMDYANGIRIREISHIEVRVEL